MFRTRLGTRLFSLYTLEQAIPRIPHQAIRRRPRRRYGCLIDHGKSADDKTAGA